MSSASTGSSPERQPVRLSESIRCPWCGGAVMTRSNDLACIACNMCALSAGHVDDWRLDDSCGDSFGTIERIKVAADLFQSPWSPVVRITRRRVDEYYRRCADDPDLASRFAGAYLPFPHEPSISILDHGAGRGRASLLLGQLGHRMYLQDVVPSATWKEIGTVRAQVVPPSAPMLPWADSLFDVVLDMGVITYMPESAIAPYACEVFRVLKPGGSWVVQEANPLAPQATREAQRFRRNLHGPQVLIGQAALAGLRVRTFWFEEGVFRRLPRLQHFARNVLPGGFEYDAYGSPSQLLPPETNNRKYVVVFSKDNV